MKISTHGWFIIGVLLGWELKILKDKLCRWAYRKHRKRSVERLEERQ